MKVKIYLLLTISTTVLLITGCKENRLDQSAEETKSSVYEDKKNNQELPYDEQVKEWQKQYENMGDDVKEILEENPYKEVRKYGSLEFEVRESYNAPQEFGNFVAQTLYKFYRGQIKPEDYLNFVYDYGSTYLKKNTTTGNVNDDLELVKNLQKLMEPNARDFADYELSEVTYSEEDPNIAYIYRRMYTVTGAEKYFLITLHKGKDDTWLLAEEEASPPVKFN